MDDSPKLSPTAKRTLLERETELYWSAASAWELVIKIAKRRLNLGRSFEQAVSELVGDVGLIPLPITHAHVARLLALPKGHGDPFDRMMVAQAQAEGLVLLSSDREFREYEIEVIW
jgi:PIN domain nuclease of toxin-antitoxin system